MGLDTNPEGNIFYCESDKELEEMSKEWKKIEEKGNEIASLEAYSAIEYKVKEDYNEILYNNKTFPLSLISRYNMENLNGAMKVCESLGIKNEDFLLSMKDFKGAARRQELIFQSEKLKIYRNFAHAPSKVSATASGFREQFQDQKLFAFLALHTFSS